MVSQNDKYPDFLVLECSVCGDHFETPRKWMFLQGLGDQIIVDWGAVDLLLSTHHKMHNEDLIQGVEEFLASQRPRTP